MTKQYTIENMANDLFRPCKEEGTFFQLTDEETGTKFCFLYFTDNLMRQCRYADINIKVRYNGIDRCVCLNGGGK